MIFTSISRIYILYVSVFKYVNNVLFLISCKNVFAYLWYNEKSICIFLWQGVLHSSLLFLKAFDDLSYVKPKFYCGSEVNLDVRITYYALAHISKHMDWMLDEIKVEGPLQECTSRAATTNAQWVVQ